MTQGSSVGGSVVVPQPSPVELSWMNSINQGSGTKSQEALHQHVKAPEGIQTSLANKSVEVVKPTQTNSNDDINLDLIPSRFNHQITPKYVLALKTSQTNYISQIKQNPNELSLRISVAQNSLLLAEALKTLAKVATKPEKRLEHSAHEKDFFQKAKDENQEAKKINTFNAQCYYVESMILEYEGVDCKDFPRVEKYIQLLLTALTLNPENDEIKQKLNTVVKFVIDRWEVLANSEIISKNTRIIWSVKITHLLKEDAFKTLFRLNPSLFKLSSQAKYSAFFNAHPELKNMASFKEKHPGVDVINLVGDLTAENIHNTLAEHENNPLMTTIALINAKSSLTPEIVNEVKIGMLKYLEKGKFLTVYVGNLDDAKHIVENFKTDKLLPLEKRSLSIKQGHLVTDGTIIYAVCIENTSVKG